MNMKSEKEIRELYEQWKTIRDMMKKQGDIVSLCVLKQSEYYMKLFEWILDMRD